MSQNLSRGRRHACKEHLWGILNAIVLKVSNGPAEGLNSRIKMIKVRSRGFRN
ncbi:transposase, partial [Thiolapillus sp.]|uniref:transposase n=1 Tax=Thiolapillus sp. TaxID=2017437 RepID=UPI003AF4B101